MPEDAIAATPSNRAREPRRARRGALWAAAITVVVLGAGVLWLLRDPMPYFEARRTGVRHVEEGAVTSGAGHHARPVRIEGANGLVVELLLRYPAVDSAMVRPNATALRTPDAATGRRPAFLILGGYRSGERAAALIDDTRGTLVASFSYPYNGPLNPKGLQVLPLVPAIRHAIWDTPPAVLLALEYLRERPDVDPRRLELVGASFGAPFAAVAAVLDQRVARLWLVHGAGEPFALIRHNLRRSVSFAPARTAVAAVATLFASGPRLAPERWVPRVAPRPVIMINATDDERLPRHAIETLHRSLAGPGEVIWLEGQHVQSNRASIIRELVETVLARAERP